MRPIIPPPLILLFGIVLIWLIDRFSPFDVLIGQASWMMGLFLVAAGFLIAVSGVLEFRKFKTTVHPLSPEKASALVTSGVYRFTRNPMYLGMLIILFGAIVVSRDAATIVVAALFVVALNRLQIRPEEKALTELFGAQYEAYCQRVRRWI